jgi:serine phosphatase RsbU (regulator of sigma subunit)
MTTKNKINIVFWTFILLFKIVVSQNNFETKTEWLNYFKQQKKDTNYVLNLYEFGYFMESESLDSAKTIYSSAKTISEQLHFNTGIAKYYFNSSFILNAEGKYKQGLDLNKEGLKFAESIKNEEFIAKSLFNIGASYAQLGEPQKAIDIYQKVSKYFEKQNNFQVLVLLNDNLGSTYHNIARSGHDSISLKNAMKYYTKAIEYCEKTDNPNQLINVLLNCGNAELSLKKTGEAYLHFEKALMTAKKTDNTRAEIRSLVALQRYFLSLNSYNKSIDYGQAALLLLKQVDDKQSLIDCQKYLAQTYFELKQYSLADKYIEESMKLAETMESDLDKLYIYKSYADIKAHSNDYKAAYNSIEKYYSIKDSISGIEVVKNTNELMEKYEAEKKDLQIKNQSLEISTKQKENDAKNRLLMLGAVATIAIAIFAFFAFKNYLTVKKSNVIINDQKDNLEIKNVEISTQKELVEIKQKEIIDSINYAKRIQSAVLTGTDVWNKISKEHFILFKPKDIVSGDFYWAYNTPNGRAVFALADCTGHGVPGGFMSMLGNSFLNEIVVDSKIFKASEILNKLRQKIITALDQEGNSEQKDGMDISLCVWNKMDNTLEFAGANNPLWILKNKSTLDLSSRAESRDENKGLVEYKADKMPIGSYTENVLPFKSETIQLEKGDIIYLITDGFADQFGGPKGKKFKYRPLMDLLMQNCNEPMAQQKMVLEKAIEAWKEGYEQVDDVSLIGVRV